MYQLIQFPNNVEKFWEFPLIMEDLFREYLLRELHEENFTRYERSVSINDKLWEVVTEDGFDNSGNGNQTRLRRQKKEIPVLPG